MLSKQGQASLELWDLNPPPLLYATEQVKNACGTQLQITTNEVDILDEVQVKRILMEQRKGRKFDSVSMFYLFHCVPNPPSKEFGEEAKAALKFEVVFKNVKSVLAKGATVTGATCEFERLAGKGNAY